MKEGRAPRRSRPAKTPIRLSSASRYRLSLVSPRIDAILRQQLSTDAKLRRNSHDLDDAAQNALLRVTRGFEGLRDSSEAVLTRWTRVIGDRAAIDGAMHRSRLAETAGDLDDRVGCFENTWERVAQREILDLVCMVANGLTERSREIFDILLANAEDLEPRELSAILAIDPDAARMRRNRMRRELHVLVARRARDLGHELADRDAVKVARRRRRTREVRRVVPYTASA